MKALTHLQQKLISINRAYKAEQNAHRVTLAKLQRAQRELRDLEAANHELKRQLSTRRRRSTKQENDE